MTSSVASAARESRTEARLVESREYAPTPEFAAQPNVSGGIYAYADADPVRFWEEAARRLDWAEPWHTAHEWEPPAHDAAGELSVPAAPWFVGGRLNVAYNCVDRHVEQGRGRRLDHVEHVLVVRRTGQDVPWTSGRDVWWQSETVALPGIDVAVVGDDGTPVEPGRSGTLVVRRPWPGMARTVWGDPQRYRDSHWARFDGHGAHGGYYVAGDGATVDADGYVWILGRLDDVVPELPKTRSGKILRRLLAQLWESEQTRRAGDEPGPLGDTTSLQNPWAVQEIAAILADAGRTPE